MKTYIVQVRYRHGGRLGKVGEFTAKSHTGAIIHAARVLRTWNQDAVEFVATEKETGQ